MYVAAASRISNSADQRCRCSCCNPYRCRCSRSSAMSRGRSPSSSSVYQRGRRTCSLEAPAPQDICQQLEHAIDKHAPPGAMMCCSLLAGITAMRRRQLPFATIATCIDLHRAFAIIGPSASRHSPSSTMHLRSTAGEVLAAVHQQC